MTNNRVGSVYFLSDPRSPKDIRYIGWTIRTPRVRLMSHVYESRMGRKTHKCNWIRSLLSDGLLPEIRTVLVCSPEECPAAEVDMITEMKRLGYNLVNGTDGGEGLLNPSPEIIAKKSIAMTGRVLSPETREKIGAAHRGAIRGPRSLESRRRQSEAQTGKKRKPFTSEHRANISSSHLGITMPPRSEAHRDALSRENTGRPVGSSQREKISNSLREYWARKKDAEFVEEEDAS